MSHKPSRLERKVAKWVLFNTKVNGRVITSERAIKLLRTQLQALRREIKTMYLSSGDDAYDGGYNMACTDILALIERKLQ